MQLDPTRWLVSLAGFTYDWIITREWTRILLCMFPAVVMVAGLTTAWWGTTLDRRALAAWYMDLGEEEIEGWENSWAGTANLESAATDAESGFSLVDSENEGESADAQTAEGESESPTSEEGESENRISPYANMLFRRVQELSPTDRSQFYIAVSLAQQGAVDEGREMLEEIAPVDKAGYKPAHAFLFWILFSDFARTQDPALLTPLMHHINEAADAQRLPVQILKLGSEFFWQIAKRSSPDTFRKDDLTQRQREQCLQSLKLLRRAAEVEEKLNLEVAKRARFIDYVVAEEEAEKRGIKHFEGILEEDPEDDLARLGLAEIYLTSGKVAEAEELLLERWREDRNDKLSRGLSELYRYRFHKKVAEDRGVYADAAKLLDAALRFDPSNPMVAQDVANLAKNEVSASDEMIQKLNEFLAAGKATTLTHAWLAEAYLKRGNFAKALPHLEQVVARQNNGARYLNNLAFVLAEIRPDRMEEALQYAQRAVFIANSNNRPNADYLDTLATICSKMGSTTAAIAAFEAAINLAPTKIDFRQRLAEEYRRQGNQQLAATIEEVIAKLKEQQSQDSEAADASAGMSGKQGDSVSETQEASLDPNETTTPESGNPNPDSNSSEVESSEAEASGK